MKEPIEELFKKSLEGHQMPYNPDAWAAMNARLDTIRPVVAPRSYLPYYIAAAGIGVVAITSYFVFTTGAPESNTATANATTQKEHTTTHTNKPITGNQAKPKGNASVISNHSETTPTTDKRSQNTGKNRAFSPSWTENASQNGTGGNGSTNSDSGNPALNPTITGGTSGNSSEKIGNTTDIASAQKMIIPTISSLCLNEEVVINNTNGRSIYVFDALDRIVAEIPAKKSIVFTPSKVGTYGIGYTNGFEQVVSNHFTVNRIPDADFTFDLFNKYEDGIPTTHVEAISGQGTYVWKAGRETENGVETDLHFYKKGSQTIQLTVSDGKCSATVEKTIQIDEDYNLMAVNAFTPTSSSPENQTFMPYALTQRDVNFRMVILDGIDGGMVYETTDASLPWDGTDMRSGTRSSEPKAYVWKVTILNPESNEPSEYRGTVIKN